MDISNPNDKNSWANYAQSTTTITTAGGPFSTIPPTSTAGEFTSSVNYVYTYLVEPFTVVEFQPRRQGSKEGSFVPIAIRRNRDYETFRLGQEVTKGDLYQGRPTHGRIKEFSLLEGEVFVETTWSGIGWNLDSLTLFFPVTLPSKYQIDDPVRLKGLKGGASVIAVHFFPNRNKYDLEIHVDGKPHRLYNVDEGLILPVE